jgi:thiosulfate dehydrogenase
MAKKSGGGGRLLLGFILGVATSVGGAWAWLRYGQPPASIRQAARPIERQLGMAPAAPPIHHERAKRTPPFGISEDVFEDGARIYRKRCASCHGVPGRDAVTMGEAAPQLWTKGEGGAVGVSDQAPGDIYGKIAEGVPSSGMPAYAGKMSETEIWKVALLVKNAGTEIPDPVMRILENR